MTPEASARTVARVIRRCLTLVPGAYARALAWLRPFDHERRLYATVVRRGDVVFDVGAHQGEFTLLFSDLVGPKGLVHAFEPIAETYAKLRQRCTTTPLHNIVTNRLACAERSGQAHMWIPPLDTAQASLRRHRDGSWSRSEPPRVERVDTVALDDYVRERKLSRLDFVKCDVEGAELLVLQGMVDTLARFRPLLALEVFAPWSRDFGYRTEDLAQFADDHGYDTLVLLSSRGLEVLRRPVALTSVPGVTLLCASATRHAARLATLRSLRSSPLAAPEPVLGSARPGD